MVQKNSRVSAHRLAGDLLDRRRIEDRLQRPAAANHQAVLRAVLSGLVIRHAQHTGLLMLLHQIDRAAQQEPSVDQHVPRGGCADRVRSDSGRPNDSSK